MNTDDIDMLRKGRGPELALAYLALATSDAPVGFDAAWGVDWVGDERTVDAHVRQLRSKLGDDLPLHTVRRTGYRLD